MRYLLFVIYSLIHIAQLSAQTEVIAWEKAGQLGVHSMKVSANGRRIATASNDDQTIKITDIQSGRLIGSFANASQYSNIVYPKIDKINRLSPSGALVYWDAEVGTKLGETLKETIAVDLQPAGKNIYGTEVGWDDKTFTYIYDSADHPNRVDTSTIFVVRDIQTGNQIRWWKAYHSRRRGVFLSPDNKHLASLDKKLRDIYFYDMISGEEIALLSGHSDSIRSIYYCCGGNYLYSVDKKDTIIKWDVSSQKQVYKKSFPGAKTLSNDGSFYYKIRGLTIADVYATDSDSLLARINFQDTIYTMSLIAMDGQFLSAILAPSGKVVLWDVRSNSFQRDLFTHRGSLTSTIFTNAGNEIVCGFSSGDVITYALDGSITDRFTIETPVTALAISNTDSILYIGSTESEFIKWNRSLKSIVGKVTLPSQTPAIIDKIIPLNDNSMLLVNLVDNYVFLVNLAANSSSNILNAVRKENLDYCKKTNELIIDHGEITIYNADTWSKQGVFSFSIFPPGPNNVNFSRDGKRFSVSSIFGDYVEVWGYSEHVFFTRDPFDTIETHSSLESTTAVWGFDGDKLYCVSEMVNGGVWNLAGLFSVVSTVAGQTMYSQMRPSAVTCLAISPDSGRFLAMGSYDGTLSLWCIKDCILKTVKEEVSPVDHMPAYPNPASISVTIKLPLATRSSITLKVFDALGKTISTGYKYQMNDNNVILDIRSLPDGIYMVRSPELPELSAKFIKRVR